MKVLVSIEHPAWAHQFRYVIKELERKGHTVKVVAIKKDVDLELLNAFNIKYNLISDSSGKNIFEKGLIFIKTTYKIFIISRKFKPDLYITGASPMMAINSFLFRKKNIIFEDTEHSTFCLFVARLFTNIIITSTSFQKDLGKKQLKIDTYKELFYLHPNWFKPNQSVLTELNLDANEIFFILRFVSWDAHHDIGQHGIKDKTKFVKELEKYGRVLITSEEKLDPELEKYKITVSADKLHDLLYYATLYVGEGATTASECAVLGTHAVYINTLRLGYTDEEEEKYSLVYNFSTPISMEKKAFDKSIELLKNHNLREDGKKKRDKLLKDKIDATAFMVQFVEQYK